MYMHRGFLYPRKEEKMKKNLLGLSRRKWERIINKAEDITVNALVVITFGIMPFVGLFLAMFARCL